MNSLSHQKMFGKGNVAHVGPCYGWTEKPPTKLPETTKLVTGANVGVWWQMKDLAPSKIGTVPVNEEVSVFRFYL